jgi:rubredoxin
MKDTDCRHACAQCHFMYSHVPNCDNGEDDSWLCPKCETKRSKEIRRSEVTEAIRIERVA